MVAIVLRVGTLDEIWFEINDVNLAIRERDTEFVIATIPRKTPQKIASPASERRNLKP